VNKELHTITSLHSILVVHNLKIGFIVLFCEQFSLYILIFHCSGSLCESNLRTSQLRASCSRLILRLLCIFRICWYIYLGFTKFTQSGAHDVMAMT